MCDGCGDLNFIWKNEGGNRYCKFCWNKRQAMTKGVAKWNVKKITNKPYKPIPSRSHKRKKQESLYARLRREFLLSSPHCQANLPNKCTRQATDVHHKAGRIGNLLNDTKHWLAVCRACHDWIELNPIEAKELGFSINRLNL